MVADGWVKWTGVAAASLVAIGCAGPTGRVDSGPPAGAGGGAAAVVRGQNAGRLPASPASGEILDGYWRTPMPVSGEAPRVAQAASGVSAVESAAAPPAAVSLPPAVSPPPAAAAPPEAAPPPAAWPGQSGAPGASLPPPAVGPPALPEELTAPDRFIDIDAYVREARTGRFMFGVGVNSEAGLTGQVVIDERNFDITRWPTSLQDFINGTAFRGAGQGFRLEAIPGSELQRYLVSFTEPYLFGYMPVSLNASGFFYDRRYFDWDEQRLGGRLALGYRVTPDLSLAVAWRGENINIRNPRVLGVPELDAVLGDNDLFSGRVTLTHDTRDGPFAPTEGHLMELSFEQVFGSYDYPKGEVDYRQYFLVRERPDGSGRHTLSYSLRLGVTGAQTPVFENFFAGGFSTLRGFDFRGASPVSGGVIVGGEFRFLGSVEYMFPLTADDMLKGVVFCDFGTVEEKVALHSEDFRVAPGFGLRIAIPALGPAPLALDFAFPVAHEDTDDIENFSFFFGFGRG